jgi:hypothetical protein
MGVRYFLTPLMTNREVFLTFRITLSVHGETLLSSLRETLIA